MRSSPLIVLTFALFTPALAHAQCAEGRVVTPETEGNCCWPGQRWNAVSARCEGAPSCPGGRVAEADTCRSLDDEMVGAPPASYGERLDEDAGSTPGGSVDWTSATPSVLDGSWTAPSRFEPELELMWAGVITGAVGYLFSIVVGVFDSTQCCLRAVQWPWFVPLVGPVLVPAIDRAVFASVLAIGAPASAAQLAGLVLLLFGGLARRPVRDAPTIAPGPGSVGMSLRWEL